MLRALADKLQSHLAPLGGWLAKQARQLASSLRQRSGGASLRELLAPLRERLESLDARETYALTGLAVFLALLLFYLAIWAPVNAYVSSSQLERDRQLGLLQYFKSTEAEARAQKGGAAPSQSLLSQVSRAAQAQGLSPSRIQPEGRDAVSVWYDQVPYTRLMRWLEQLEASDGLAVRQLSMEARSAPGQVSARLVLRR